MDEQMTLAKKITIAVVKRAIEKEVINMLMEPNVDRTLALIVANKLELLMEAYRVEDYTFPEVWQDLQDPTTLNIKFEFVPSREFDWDKEAEWITVEFNISPRGVSEE